MGAFYGSINVFTADTAMLQVAAEKVFRKLKQYFYMSPCIAGWVSIYPEGQGQDSKPAELLARKIKADIVQFIVHDDDVFILNYWRNGKEQICFMSTPGYFDEGEYDHELKAYPGSAAQFKKLLGNRADTLTGLFKRNTAEQESPFTFESDRLKKIAAVFRIKNAQTSFEQLEDGETKQIKGWKDFLRLPKDRFVRRRKEPTVVDITYF